MLKCVNRQCRHCTETKDNGCGLFNKNSIKECKVCIFRDTEKKEKEATYGSHK